MDLFLSFRWDSNLQNWEAGIHFFCTTFFLSHFDFASTFFLKCGHRKSAPLQETTSTVSAVTLHSTFCHSSLLISELLISYLCILRTFLCAFYLVLPWNPVKWAHMNYYANTKKTKTKNNACKWVYFFSNQCLRFKVVTFHFSCTIM